MTAQPHRREQQPAEPPGPEREPARRRAGLAGGPATTGIGPLPLLGDAAGPTVRTGQPPRPPLPPLPPRPVARPGQVTGPNTVGLRLDAEDDAPAVRPAGTTDGHRDDDPDGEPPLTAVPDAPGHEVTGEAPVDTPSGAPRVTGRAGRDMAAAIGVGLALGGTVIATLLVWRPAFLLVLTVAVVISIMELTGALRNGGHQPPRTPVVVGALAMVALAWTRGPSGLVVAFLLTVFAVLLWRLGDGPLGYLRDASAGVFVALYVPLLAGFAVLLLVPDDGVARVLAFIATVVCSDVGGFAAGVLFGRHPLAKSISPKKSWEGLAGSVTACVVIGVALATLTFHVPWWGGALFGVSIALTATLGDLGESLIKRDLGIKDMGDLLPGHGGLMDRMDSLLPSAAVAWLVLSAVAPV
ncbi:phosphatidate cytidylyltransferase [Modestobacter sp. VKM Ac-2986]|uniref:phosphatidate cytidylyltransferase n=1 Tax=Modestobacter sp. VKM Ac-2986 TaxID=3004140 RepID=UPI0022AB831A|nr:phosphatidate cytidylyltransferase [Modestobacter sp. VKM Ac-2986]MCZ2829432.1 phosphatidate cytidylyltransferase [Modestobacter sp. VKM Ac-2986]